MKQYVVIYTDGACAGNPGPGGWAAIIKYDGSKEELGDSLSVRLADGAATNIAEIAKINTFPTHSLIKRR